MDNQFSKHYTVEEARKLLPQIREWLDKLERLTTRLKQVEKRYADLLNSGADLGGPSINQWVNTLADAKVLLEEFATREIVIKDLNRGLIDFPSLRDGREVFLCWEKDEEDIEHWHDLESGYPGREPL